MKDLRIVIVSWNVQDKLEACLRSLDKACEGLDWDCVVVDNASSDGSVDAVKQFADRDERIDLIINRDNRGFAAACDQGASHHKARYVLLLNPDTECPPGSLKELVAVADRHPEAGIVGPKLTYPDGRYQPSAQRFPTWRDQTLIQFKLHHVWRQAPSLQRYFSYDLDKDKAQDVDQVMGACFLVRSELWDQVNGLDQRYFIWFEEVDFCKQAIENGWKVRYEPSVCIIHHEGQAFSKVFSYRRQRYFNDSLRQYMRKWHGFGAWFWFGLLNPISLGLAAAITPFRIRPGTRQNAARSSQETGCAGQLRIAWAWLLVVLAVEALSACALNHVWLQIAGLAGLGLAMIFVAYRRPAVGLTAVALELAIGGMGHLLEAPFAPFAKGISLRMVLMAAFFVGWGANGLRHRIWRYWKLRELAILQVWVFVAGMILGGWLRGMQLGQPGIFNDLNAWLFLLYFIPVLDVAHRHGRELGRQAVGGLAVGVIWLCLKMLLVFALLAHETAIGGWLYAWIRDTRVGELTPMGGLYRVFFQSAVYAVMTLVIVSAWWLEKGFINNLRAKAKGLSCLWQNNQQWIIGVLATTAVLVSLSRSFWIGSAVGGVVLLSLAIKARKGHFVQTAGCLVGCGAIAMCLIAALTFFPWPQPKAHSLADFFANRVQAGDEAADSRWNLWPAMWQKIESNPILGQGFGGSVTYRSRDPRVIQQHPDGMYTTQEFEWGWLGLWIKFGVFGPMIMLWLLGSLVWRSWRSGYDWWIRAGVVAGTIALAVIHFFTPYLDHPLGFGWLLSIEGLLAVEREIHEPSDIQD